MRLKTWILVLFATVVITVPSLAQGQGQGQAQGTGEPEIIKHKPNPHEAAPSPTAGSTGTVTPAIAYHGGPVIAIPTIYYIWYGNWNQANGTDTPGGQQILRDLATNIGSSPHFMLNSSYSISGTTITGSASFGGDTTDAYSRGSRLRDSDIRTIVINAIQGGKLPNNPAGIYFVLTSSDVTATSGFCTRYCGWHTYTVQTIGTIRYSFVGNAARCLNACAAQTVGPNGNAGVDGMASVLIHELEEATTDPNLNAWYDSNGAENADKCAWTFGQNQTLLLTGAYYNMTLGSRNFLIQRNLYHKSSGDTCNVTATQQ